ncbi:transporter [Aquaticitalea lipolytica]|jgi:outer membrane protein TolC|uniref:Transporter n=1 Tax=Aquaticitalea lipolytica TaxID=1247562 RepID=A0A8J2TQZ3_9FLAO|nr:TolC family protein [Aquaticitalea lipolytica]GFZ90844.1 transporter [Aquaticitalea lipolytica]
MYKKIIITLVVLLPFLGLSQENTQSFSLQEAIDFALQNNRTSKNAERDIEAAKQRKWETTATGLPQINGKIEYQNWLKQQVSLLPAAAFDNTQSVIDVVNDYFDANQTNFDVNSPDGFIPVRFGTKQTMNASVTVSQLIFDGSYLVGLQSAKVYLEISENAKVKTDLEVRKAVINAYGNVLLAEESVQILQRNKEVLQKNLNDLTKIYENGLEEEESVEQLQITLSSVESSLKNTERLKTLAYQMFNITLGIDLNNNSVLTDNLETLTQENISLTLLEADANVENTIDYQIAENDKVSKELLLKLEKSKALPSLSAFVNAGYSGNADNFDFLKKEQQWFGSSLLGVSMNIPIFSSLGRSASTQRAKINLEKAEDDLLETQQKLQLQISSAKSNYQFAIEDYDNKKQNLKLAERIEAKNQTKFFEGIASSFDLRQAQTQLYTAQQEFLQAMLDVITKKAELETILNSINKQ